MAAPRSNELVFLILIGCNNILCYNLIISIIYAISRYSSFLSNHTAGKIVGFHIVVKSYNKNLYQIVISLC